MQAPSGLKMRFRYVVAKLDPNPGVTAAVNVGVIVQSDTDIKCKFLTDQRSIRELRKSVNEEVFSNLQESFMSMFKTGSINVSGSTGVGQVSVNDPRYLEWLRRNYLGNYKFGELRTIEAPDIGIALQELYREYVGGQGSKTDDALPIETGMDVVLVVLGAIDKGEVCGSTRLEKLIYVIQKESGIRSITDADLRYRAHNYGPFSAAVYDSADALSEMGLTSMRETAAGDFIEEVDSLEMQAEDVPQGLPTRGVPKAKIYSLTSQGRRAATDLLKSLSPEEQKRLIRLANKLNSMHIESLLKYVYKTYPEMTGKSKIKDRFST